MHKNDRFLAKMIPEVLLAYPRSSPLRLGIGQTTTKHMWDIFTPNVLITIAGGLFTIGYLIINQVILRISIFLGSLTYIAYYATAADTPLWGAIYTTLIMTAANLIGLATLLAGNAKFAVPKEHRDLYKDFGHITPGDFRSLMKLATRYKMPEDRVVTREGQPVDKVYYVVQGRFQVEKLGTTFPINTATFIGEAAYILKRESAATVTLPKGTEVVEWELGKLKRAANRRPRIKLAFDAAISKDLAIKVALAVAPSSTKAPAIELPTKEARQGS